MASDSTNSNASSKSQRCAACKYLRRRCAEDCTLSPYFPASDSYRFACVHKIFGAGNVARMLQQLPVSERGQAAESMVMEAHYRMQDPIYGSAGIITLLRHQIVMNQHELASTHAQIAVCAAQQTSNTQQLQQQQQQNPHPVAPDSTSLDPHQFPHLI